MKITIYSLNFYPEIGAEPIRLYEISKRLVQFGYDVTVITSIPNYPIYKIYNGYKYQLRNIEYIDGINIIQTCLIPPQNGVFFSRLLNILSFIISSILFSGEIFRQRDIFLFNSPPIFLVPAALLFGKLSRAKIIMNVPDIWPQAITQIEYKKCNPILYKIMNLFEIIGYKYSDLVTLSTPASQDAVIDRFSNLKTDVISCGVDRSKFYTYLSNMSIRTKHDLGYNDFVIGFCGLHGWAHGLLQVLESAKQLSNYKQIKFLFIGDGPVKKYMIEQINKHQLSNVCLIDSINHNEVPDYLSTFNVGLNPTGLAMNGTMPAKTYELLASGVPMIVASGNEASKLTLNYNLGYIYEVNNHNDLTHQIIRMYNNRDSLHHYSDNCYLLAEQFDYNNIAQHTANICLSLLKK